MGRTRDTGYLRNLLSYDASGNITTTGTISASGGTVSYLPLSGGTLTGGLSGTTISTSGNVGVRVNPSTASDQYLTTGDAGIAYSNTYFGTGKVRIGGGSDHGSNTVLSIAPGVVSVDAPGVAAGRFILNSAGNVGIRNATPRATLHVQQATNDGTPVLGTARDGVVITSNNSNYGLNIGIDPSGLSWMQSMRFDNVATAYGLSLQPSGGSVGIGTGPTEGSQAAGTMSFITNSTVSSGPLIQLAGNGRIRPASTGDRLSIEGNALYLNTVVGGNVIMATAGGSVGINTASPSQKLHVNGVARVTGLQLDPLYSASYTTDSSWTSFQTVIPGNTLPSFETVLVELNWNYGGTGAPYYASASFLFRPVSTNSGGVGNEIALQTSCHVSGGYVIYVAQQNVTGGGCGGLAVRFSFTPSAPSYLEVKVKRISVV